MTATYSLSINAIGVLIFILCELVPIYLPAQDTWTHRKHAQWESGSPPDSSQLISSIYLIGDAGQAEKDRTEPNFKQILQQAQQTKSGSDVQQSLIFLGDNIYKVGLPPEGAMGRTEAERRINAQLDLIKEFPGQGYMVPGNHDWHRQSMKGWDAVRRQQAYVDAYLNDTTVFQPRGGCPGPIVVELSESQVLILIDTEWFLHRHNKPLGPDDGCEVVDDVDFFVQIHDALQRHEGKHIMIAMHHPMFSNGSHGGYYTLKEHIFPLTDLKEDLFIPLPIIGTLYPLARKYGISPEDLPHPRYQMLIDGLLGAIGQQAYVVMAAGHEHSLALHPHEQAYHILSGSGTKVTKARKGRGADFVYDGKGFSRVNYYEDGEVWAEFWRPIEDGSTGELLFRMPLYARDSTSSSHLTSSFTESAEIPHADDDSVTAFASKVFQRSGLYRAILGSHNRDLWTANIKVPHLNLHQAGGGLTPIKKGGGFQTQSLRLQGKNGYQYTIRSIDKDPEKFLPQGLRNTLAHTILKDQISVSNPYGAFAIPKLADAAGVFHTNPRLVSVPFSPHLDHHLDEFGGMLALFEIRPDEDLSEFNRFGNSHNVVSSRKMFERLKKDNDNEVDKKQFAKSRLFDMLIGDLDRHQDQWRWAEYKHDDGSRLYKPIPRDRDQVFLKVDGLIPNILTAKWAIREIESYEFEIQDLWGLNNRGFPLDQQLLADYSEKDWMAAAEEIKTSLTDEIIETAIQDLPKEIYELSGERIIPRLKQRRDDLPQYASQYYHLQAKEVVIVGSDKREKYEIIRHKNKETEIIGHKIKKNGKEGHKLFKRTIDPSETNEIRVYGLGGDDRFIFKGKGKGEIKIRIIGGPGEDQLEDHSDEKKASKKAIYYDEAGEKQSCRYNLILSLEIGQ